MALPKNGTPGGTSLRVCGCKYCVLAVAMVIIVMETFSVPKPIKEGTIEAESHSVSPRVVSR